MAGMALPTYQVKTINFLATRASWATLIADELLEEALQHPIHADRDSVSWRKAKLFAAKQKEKVKPEKLQKLDRHTREFFSGAFAISFREGNSRKKNVGS